MSRLAEIKERCQKELPSWHTHVEMKLIARYREDIPWLVSQLEKAMEIIRYTAYYDHLAPEAQHPKIKASIFLEQEN